MRELSRTTRFVTTTQALQERKWQLLDAKDQPLGRLASRVAQLLRGKHKPQFQPNLPGDYVIVINAAKVSLSGKKLIQKIDFRHSFYPGGARFLPYNRLMAQKPEQAVKLAVKGMLPKTPLGRKMRRMLFVYRGAEHPHAAQKPAAPEAEALPNTIAKL